MKRKLIACLAAGMALCTAVAMFAGCSDNNPEKQPDDGDTPGGTTQATTEWQFTGTYHDLMKNGFDFYFLGNMLSDGSGVIYHAQWMNGNISYTEIELEWESTTDRDGLTTFNASTDDASAGFTDVSLYAETDGIFNWEYKFLFAGGYSRTIDFIGTDEPEYATVDEWKAFVEEDAGTYEPEVPEEPEKEAILTFAGGEGNSIEFYADNTARIKGYGGQINFEYTWTIADGVITMTSVSNPSEKITSTTADGVTTIVYSANLAGNQVELTFTCADISALEGVAEKVAIVTFDGGAGNSIEFYADGTALLSAYNGAMSFDYTWTVAEGVITMTSVDNPSEKITSTTADGVTTIVYTASFLGDNSLTFTCSDISALESVE